MEENARDKSLKAVWQDSLLTSCHMHVMTLWTMAVTILMASIALRTGAGGREARKEDGGIMTRPFSFLDFK